MLITITIAPVDLSDDVETDSRRDDYGRGTSWPDSIKTALGRPIYGTADLNMEVGLMKVLTRTSARNTSVGKISLQKIMQYKPTENNLCVVILRAKQLAKKN